MAVEIADTLDRIGGNGDYPLVKSEDASYSNADKTEATNVKDALDELYDVNKKEHLKEFDPNGFLSLTSGAQLNDVNGIKIENNEIAKYIGLALYGEVIYDENGEIVDDTIEWENGKDFNPDKITLHRGEKYRINYYYINDTQRIIIRPADNNNIVSVQSDWNETDENSLAFIKNKPNLSSVATSGDITIIDETFIDYLLYKQSDGTYYPETYSINLPANKIIFYNGKNIKEFCSDNGTVLGTLLPGNFYITKSSDYRAYDYNDELKTVVWGESINLEYQTNGYGKLYKQNELTTIDYTRDIIEIHHNSYEGDEMNFIVELELEYPNYKLQGKNIKIFYFNDNTESNIALKIIPKNDSVVYTVKDSATTYNIPYGGRFIMIDVYILQECLMVEVTENINKNTNVPTTS